MDSQNSEQIRIILWGAPRSMTTAFYRAMTNYPGVKTVFEPYLRAYYMGSERKSTRYHDTPVEENCTFLDMKKVFEEEYSGARVVIARQIAHNLSDRLSTTEFLPKGYKHVILIRDPRKSVPSLYRMMERKTSKEWDHFESCEAGYRELYELYELVSSQTDQEPIIISAADVLSDPETMMKLFCEKTGLDYSDRLLHWQHPPDIELYGGEVYRVWYETVMSSTSFDARADRPVSDASLRELPQEVQDAVEENLPFYHKLNALRLKP